MNELRSRLASCISQRTSRIRPAVQCQLSGESFCTTLRSVGAVAAQRWRTVTGWINVLWFIILLYSYSDAHWGLAAMVKSFGD